MIYLFGKGAMFQSYQRRRMKTEEKAKVVASVWGEEFIQLLAALGTVFVLG